MSNKVAVIDYGMGNLHSVASALEKVSAEIEGDVLVQVPRSGERRGGKEWCGAVGLRVAQVT